MRLTPIVWWMARTGDQVRVHAASSDYRGADFTPITYMTLILWISTPSRSWTIKSCLSPL